MMGITRGKKYLRSTGEYMEGITDRKRIEALEQAMLDLVLGGE